MKRIQAMCLSAVAAVAGLAWSAQPAIAAVLDQTPSDAVAVFEIRNLSDLNAKWGKFADATGLSQLDRDQKDPLGDFEKDTGLTQGLNPAGDCAVAIFHSEKGRPQFLLLFPVSDYKAFLGNFTNVQEGADGISSATEKDAKVFAIAHWGDYAAMTRDETKALLGHRPLGITPTGKVADAVKTKDAVLVFNMDQVRAQVLPEVKKSQGRVVEMLGKLNHSSNPAMNEFGVNVMFDQIEEMMQDARSAAVTLQISDDGIAASTLAEFSPDTPYGKLAAAMKGTDRPLFTGLPDKHYMMLFGLATSPELKQQLIATVLDPMGKKIDASDDSSKLLQDMLAVSKAKMQAIDTANAGMVTPAGNPGQESMIQVVGAMTGDAQAWKKAQMDGLKLMGDNLKNANPNGPVAISVVTKPDAVTVSDVHFDQFEFKIDPVGNNPRAMIAAQIRMMVFGPGGVSGYIGAASDKTGVVTAFVDSQSPLMADTVAAVKSGKDVVSTAQTVQNVAGQLPKTRVAEGFVYFDQIAKVVSRAAQMIPGAGFNLKIPADVDPLGFALSSDGTTMQGDVYVPQSLVKAIVGGVNDVNAAHNGGAAGGPPPGGL